MTNEEKKLNANEVADVSGGMEVEGGKNFGGRCKHYVCRGCGAPATDWTYIGKMCFSVTVTHNPDCPVFNDILYQDGTARDCCGNCKHSTGFAKCDIPND